MPLSTQVVSAVLAEIAATNIDAVMAQVRNAYVAGRVTAARNALASAVTLTVADWDALQAALTPGVSSTAVYPLRDQIQAKIDARDADGLGAMLLAFFSSGKAHLG